MDWTVCSEEVNDVGRAVSEAVYLYNVERPHQSLGYATPAEVYSGQVQATDVVVTRVLRLNDS